MNKLIRLRRWRILALLSLLPLLSIGAYAYETQGNSWPGSTAHYNMLTTTNAFDVAFTEAMEKWNGRSNFSFSSAAIGYTDPCQSAANLKNSYRFSTTNCGNGWNSSTLAVTYVYSDFNDNLIDTDIVFNSDDFSWSVYDGNLGSSIDFRRVAVHELGHALGLDHTTNVDAIMQPSITHSIIDPQTDDTNGLRAIYGGSGDDFFVESSSLSSSSVLPGDSTLARTEQHYSGTGSTTLRPELGYYVSVNTRLDVSDTLLAVDTSDLNVSDVSDQELATLVLPSSLAPGDYNILFVADHDNQYIESRENNNVQAISITINAPSESVLSVTISGEGNVTSNPAGINCPQDCSERYAEGTSISLTPVATDGWQFTRWDGACSGAVACTVLMNSNRTVIALFTRQGVSIPAVLLLLLDEPEP